MSETEVWRGAVELDDDIERMARELRERLAERGIDAPLMIGIHTGGVWLAERLHALLGLAEPLGQLDIAFYRDDFTRIGMQPQVRPSHIPLPIEDRDIVLVDDVIQTGRTIRAALNELFDYGRPARVLLVTLVERNGRELPIAPEVVGVHAALGSGQQIKLTGPDPLTLVLGQVPKRKKKPAAGVDAS